MNDMEGMEEKMPLLQCKRNNQNTSYTTNNNNQLNSAERLGTSEANQPVTVKNVKEKDTAMVIDLFSKSVEEPLEVKGSSDNVESDNKSEGGALLMPTETKIVVHECEAPKWRALAAGGVPMVGNHQCHNCHYIQYHYPHHNPTIWGCSDLLTVLHPLLGHDCAPHCTWCSNLPMDQVFLII